MARLAGYVAITRNLSPLVIRAGRARPGSSPPIGDVINLRRRFELRTLRCERSQNGIAVIDRALSPDFVRTIPGFVRIDDEVQAAVAAGRPVVALESTIITHGMPYPENLAMARGVEEIVRGHGATPATIALIDGSLRVGLNATMLERLASRSGVAKASRRDLAALIVRGETAGTTVAATMAAAALAGIALFATGGIGGVHRGAAETFDVSADLRELATSPVAVICAGAKSILDIGKTLEYLESLGVPVLGYGAREFPAFFTRRSGFSVEHQFDTPRELALVIATHRELGLAGGILIANPIPQAAAMPEDEIEAIIAQSVGDAQARGIGGKELTPFLLGRINALTAGASLTANIALVKANASLAAAVAVELARIRTPIAR